ncbi:MAG: recombination mediator RecR [Gemmataceae bacterium]|nr:recombination mediator RecR [Gemmataceae bacterium]
MPPPANGFPEPQGAIARLAWRLGKLPGIGPKSAERLTQFLLSADPADVLSLADALRDVKEKVRPCSECFTLTEGELCAICSDARRDPKTICVVEQSRDVAQVERSGIFRGVYHVLGGRLAPLENMGPEKLTLDALMMRVRKNGAREVILGTNPTFEGDGTALYISNLLASSGVRITRLARGLPAGSSLEFANNQMLADALEGRRDF